MTVDPNNPEILTSVTSDIEAAAIVAALAAQGIEASTTGGFTAGFRAEAPGVINVIVRQRDLVGALQIFNHLKEADGLDWSQVDVGDPEKDGDGDD